MSTLVLRLSAFLVLVVTAIGSYFFLARSTTPDTTLVVPTGTAVVVEAETPAEVAVLPASATTIVPSATAILPTSTPLPTPTQPARISELQAVDKYGNQTFDSLEAMPPDLRRFYEESIQAIATFFQVRNEDLLALVQQQGGGQFRLPVAEGETIGLVPAELWNGPGTPPGTPYLTNLQRIEQSGGMGFAWLQYRQWETWVQGRGAVNISDVTADPYRFTNGVAALARYLSVEQVTATLATQDPDLFEQRRTAAIDGLVAATNRSALASPTGNPSGNEWAGALQQILDERLGMALPADEAIVWVEGRGITGRTANPADGAATLYAELMQEWMAEGRNAASENRPLPWPYVQDETDIAVQELAVRVVGHVLTAPELKSLRDSRSDNLGEIEASLAARTEATLYAETRTVADQALQRSSRGMRLWNYEVSALVQSALSTGNNSFGGGGGGGGSSSGSSRSQTRTRIRLASEVQYFLRRMPDYRALHGDQFFSATPFEPMVSMGQPYGSPVDYQAGGIHTGVDIRARGSGDATLIHAVEAGTIAHVGPLFCLSDSACRGPYAVVIDHGNNVYTVYSHNSEAFVTAGEQVTAGQVIARQGSEGYSRGPHLHLELHVGSPYSGDWTNPWRGGQYIDPWPWLPKEGDTAVNN
jgi:murein DD-endopeptidase MepM/ murein hydrolase activator NlpD